MQWFEQFKKLRKIKKALKQAKVTDRPKDLKELLDTFYFYKQKSYTNGPYFDVWGFGFDWDQRKHFYTHSIMGWNNHSETHRKENCTDPAYCGWHGTL